MAGFEQRFSSVQVHAAGMVAENMKPLVDFVDKQLQAIASTAKLDTDTFQTTQGIVKSGNATLDLMHLHSQAIVELAAILVGGKMVFTATRKRRAVGSPAPSAKQDIQDEISKLQKLLVERDFGKSAGLGAALHGVVPGGTRQPQRQPQSQSQSPPAGGGLGVDRFLYGAGRRLSQVRGGRPRA
jgi:hypothetical protein